MWSSFLPKLFSMSLTGGFVILVILLVRLTLCRAPRIFSYVLWVVALLRLLCPFAIKTPVSVLPETGSIVESVDYSLADEPISPLGAGMAAYRAVGDAINGGLGVQQIRTTVKDENGQAEILQARWSDVWPLFGKYVWMAGVAVLFLYSVVRLVLLRRTLIGSVPVGDNVYLADHITSPFVLGVFCPKIYLPSTLSEEEQRYILLHERHHIHRLDHVTRILAFIALCVHWFNPLAWVAFVLSGKDMEMSCDEAVMKKTGAGIREAYSRSLVSLSTGRRIIAGTPLAFGEGDTRSRVKNIMSYRKPAFWVIAVAVIVCMILFVCLLTDPMRGGNTDVTFGADNEELYEKYPEYFNLNTFKGLEVYVWQFGENNYNFGLMEGTNREKTLEEKMALKRADAEEMKQILATYDIEDRDIFVIPWGNPMSSYMLTEETARDPEYIDRIRGMLGLELIDRAGLPFNIPDNMVCEDLSAGVISTTASEVGENVLYTNSEQISVTVASNTSGGKCVVKLWYSDHPEDHLQVHEMDSGSGTVTFRNLTSRFYYRVTCEGAGEDAQIFITD